MKINILFILALWSFTATAQCYPDRHSTSWYDGWISCETSENPNPARGVSHWILYDLGEPYILKTSKLWNSNDPIHLDYGIKDFTIDYSNDKITWTTAGNFTLTKAEGIATYEGSEGPDFQNIKARFVLITPSSNYGGNCYGFSELKINTADETGIVELQNRFEALVYPNPFVNELTVKVFGKDESNLYRYEITDITGRMLLNGILSGKNGEQKYLIPNLELRTGVYLISIIQNQNRQTFKIVRK